MTTDTDPIWHNARWTDDCAGKKNFDGDVLSISTRYWPAGGGFFISKGGKLRPSIEVCPDIKPSATAALMLRLAGGRYIAIVAQAFKADTPEEVFAAVEVWATAQFNRAIAALSREFGDIATKEIQ